MAKKNIMERNFSALDELSEKHLTVSDIVIQYNIEKEQAFSHGGISFKLMLTNNSSSDKLVLNPLDFFHVIMEDEEGWPLQLPSAGPNRHIINAAKSIEIKRPYQIKAFDSSQNESSLLDIVNNEKIILKGNTTYKYTILIDRVLDIDRENALDRTTKSKPLSKGKYKINLKMSILLAEKRTIHTTCESGYIDIEIQ